MEGYFYAVFTVQATLGLTEACCNVIVLKSLVKAISRMHANVFLLLKFKTVAATAFGSICFARGIFLLAAGRSFPISSQLHGRLCGLADLFRVICACILAYALVIIACERAKTIRRSPNRPLDGEQPERSLKVALFMLVVCSSVWCGVVLQASIPEQITPVARHCLGTFLTSIPFGIIAIIASFSVEVVSLVLFAQVSRHCRCQLTNFAKNQTQLSLSNRMHLRRTIELTNALLPAARAHATVFIVLYIAWAVRVYTSLRRDLLGDHLQELPLLLGEIVAFLPIEVYCLYYAYCIARLLKLVLVPCQSDTDGQAAMNYAVIEEPNNQTVHFAALQEQWSAAFEEKRKHRREATC